MIATSELIIMEDATRRTEVYSDNCTEVGKRRIALFQKGRSCVSSLWEYLDTIESDSTLLLVETFYLVGLFVQYGRQFIFELDHESWSINTMYTSELLTKYTIGNKQILVGFEMEIDTLVSGHPLAVAYHLSMDQEMFLRGDLNGLPKCLAFNGGLVLIPKVKEWQPLTVLWKIWFNSAWTCYTSEDYAWLTYYRAKRFDPEIAMRLLNIKIPSSSEVMGLLNEMIGISDETFNYIEAMFSIQDKFPFFTTQIISFYFKHIPPFQPSISLRFATPVEDGTVYGLEHLLNVRTWYEISLGTKYKFRTWYENITGIKAQPPISYSKSVEKTFMSVVMDRFQPEDDDDLYNLFNFQSSVISTYNECTTLAQTLSAAEEICFEEQYKESNMMSSPGIHTITLSSSDYVEIID